MTVLAFIGVGMWLFLNPESYEQFFTKVEDNNDVVAVPRADGMPLVSEILEKLEVKGRAPKTGYSREQFYDGWPLVDGCSLRQRIIKRELGDTAKLKGCNVIAGEFDEPYTGKHMVFTDKSQISNQIQIDHVVALSDAWQKGAQYKDYG